MRYYGMSNNSTTPVPQNIEEKPAVTPQPQPQQQVPVQNRTFNRPNSTSGLYNGQAAQNVTSVREWIEEQPPAVLPPGNGDFSPPTIYEYPATQRSAVTKPVPPTMPCQTETTFSTHLCGHIGDYAYIALSDGMEKRGTVESVGKDFITLSDSGNHIMCPLYAISSINIIKPRR